MSAPPEDARSIAILGEHPAPPHPFGEVLTATTGITSTGSVHRALVEIADQRPRAIELLREMVVRHHTSPEALDRTRRQREAIERLGFAAEQARISRFPATDATQKGNIAEIVLAEYVVAANSLTLPIYRLHYNPNVDQSMKGDDVLAFDLDSEPIKLVVGEAKFRAESTAVAVKEIADALARSHKSGVPISLQFVADRLFESGEAALGTRVLECAVLFARGKLRLDYVGLLFSDANSADRVHAATPRGTHRLAMISLSVDDPSGLVGSCYAGLE